MGIDLGASSHKRVGEDDATAIAMHALLVEELDTLGWESVVAVDLDRVAVTLTATDARGVAHHVEVLLPSTYPSTAPLVHTALPLPFALAWPPPGGERRGGLLGAVLDQFSNELERHQAVWRELDVFDEVCVCVRALAQENERKRHFLRDRDSDTGRDRDRESCVWAWGWRRSGSRV